MGTPICTPTTSSKPDCNSVASLGREPRPFPRLVISGHQWSIEDFEYDDFTVVGYQPDPAIKAPVAV